MTQIDKNPLYLCPRNKLPKRHNYDYQLDYRRLMLCSHRQAMLGVPRGATINPTQHNNRLFNPHSSRGRSQGPSCEDSKKTTKKRMGKFYRMKCSQCGTNFDHHAGTGFYCDCRECGEQSDEHAPFRCPVCNNLFVPSEEAFGQSVVEVTTWD